MKRIFSLLIILIMLFSFVVIPIPSSAKASVGVKEGYLNEDKWLSLSQNTSGPRYFVDSKGNPVQLFGMARCQGHAHEEDVLFSSTDGVDAVIDHYTKEGCNFIRLAIDPGEVCGGMVRTPEQLNDFIVREVDPDVQAIIRSGAYVMLDLHEIAAPGAGNTIEEYDTWARDYYMPLTIALAKFYKDEPMIAAYELWNEPFAAPYSKYYPQPYYGWAALLKDYYIENVNRIREIDTRHVILVSDCNAGWGTAMADTWDGHYDEVDPVYRNTAFSVHAQHDQFDFNFAFYSDWWKKQAKANNICIIFGELETEPNITTEQGIINMFKFFSETESEFHFSGVMWRPHADHIVYAQHWLTNGWVKKYCNPAPMPMARYAADAEDCFGASNKNIELICEPDLFGYLTGSGISMKPNLKPTQFYESTSEISDNIIYKDGKYKLYVRACGKDGYDGDFIVGYRDIDGVVHQIAQFGGKNTNGEHYYQSVEFTAKKQIISFVYFSCENSKMSAIIDRVYLIGAESDNETVSRSRTDFADINKVVDLSGKSYEIDANNTENELIENKNPVTNNSNSNQETEDETEDSESETDGDSSNKKTVTSTTVTTKSTSYSLYIWIGGGVLGAAVIAAAVWFIVIRVKNKIQNNGEDEDEKDS